jgi:hypothetical protein
MQEKKMNVEISIKVNAKFDSLYKLGYFLIDLNSLCNFTQKINIDKLQNKPYKALTARHNNKDSLETIQLISFEQGSFISNILAPLAVGLILMFFGKHINKDKNKPKIEINININSNNNVNLRNAGDINNTNITNIGNTYNAEKSPGDNLLKMLQKAKEEGFCDTENIIHNEEGRKELIKIIERIEKEIVNDKW